MFKQVLVRPMLNWDSANWVDTDYKKKNYYKLILLINLVKAQLNPELTQLSSILRQIKLSFLHFNYVCGLLPKKQNKTKLCLWAKATGLFSQARSSPGWSWSAWCMMFSCYLDCIFWDLRSFLSKTCHLLKELYACPFKGPFNH